MARHWKYLAAAAAFPHLCLASNRTVPFQVIGAGMGRTGTSSMHLALDILGISPVHDWRDSQTLSPRNQLWAEQIMLKKQGKFDTWEGIWDTPEQWDRILANFSAIVDAPGNWFVAELSRAYPDAKVVLTVRDSPEKWLESWNSSITESHRRRNKSWRWSFMRSVRKLWPDTKDEDQPRFDNPVRRALNYGDQSPDREPELSWYTNLYDHVHKYVPADRLLEFNVKQGWEPLCEFLNKPIPDVPFPSVNSRQTFLERNSHWKIKNERKFNTYAAGLVTIFAVIVGLVYYSRTAKKAAPGGKSTN